MTCVTTSEEAKEQEAETNADPDNTEISGEVTTETMEEEAMVQPTQGLSQVQTADE